MQANEFLEVFKELIQTDMEIESDTLLQDIEEWDSMAIMAIIAYFDVEHGKTVDFEDLMALSTVGDVASLVPGLEK